MYSRLLVLLPLFWILMTMHVWLGPNPSDVICGYGIVNALSFVAISANESGVHDLVS